MVNLTINGLRVQAEEGQTILEVARDFLGINIPTLCYLEGLTPYGACRLCTVEVDEGRRTRLVTSCTYPVKEGIVVKTDSERVIKARRMIVELLLSSCPNSRKLQDLAASMGINRVRFKMEKNDCILCGLCVRMCKEQMRGEAIGFAGRGVHRKVAVPFDKSSEVCRNCGACMYICPAVETQCRGVKVPGEICGGCQSFVPVCLDSYDHVMCFLEVCGACVKKEEAKL